MIPGLQAAVRLAAEALPPGLTPRGQSAPAGAATVARQAPGFLRDLLVIVYNPVAGSGQESALHEAVAQACTAARRDFEWLVVRHPQDLHATAAQAVRMAQQAGGIVVAAGGDGTLNAVAAAVLPSGCRFGVLPLGTFNYFSRTHGIPTELADALQLLLQGTARPVQVGLVNERLFLVNASLGLYPTLLEEREQLKSRWGRHRLVALGAGLMTLLHGHRNLHLRVSAAGVTRELRTPTLFVGNNALQMEQMGLPQAHAIDAGQLAAVALRPVGRWSMLGLVARAAAGELGRARQVVDFAFHELGVDAGRGLGARRLKVATDGEVMWMALPLVFRVAPRPLLLIRPEGQALERARQ